MFGSVELTKSADLEKCKYNGRSIGFDSRSEFLFTDRRKGRNVIVFGADMSSSVPIDSKNKDILILDDTKLTAEAKYHIDFTQFNKRFVLSLHYNGINSFLFVNAAKIYQFKAKSSEIKNYALCLGNISKDFTINDLKKTGLREAVNFFSVDFNPIDTNDIWDIHKYLKKKHDIKQCLG